MDGYNVCIFAYGQTGSGKTFTMEGTEENPGINYRALQEVFAIAEERAQGNVMEYQISTSVMEIYNETIRDLLQDPDKPPSKYLNKREEILLEIVLQLCSSRSKIVCYRVAIQSPIESPNGIQLCLQKVD
jgi:hypothetical protein